VLSGSGEEKRGRAVRLVEEAGRFTAPVDAPNHYVENLRVADLSLGTYSIPAGGTDDQSPHTEDEIYLVQAGRARLVAGGSEIEVGPGSVIYVPAGEEHRFIDVTDDLTLVVGFATLCTEGNNLRRRECPFGPARRRIMNRRILPARIPHVAFTRPPAVCRPPRRGTGRSPPNRGPVSNRSRTGDPTVPMG
jgi:mannose-6-phosphate isomerase-like protein (cupin superfamily)